MPKAGEPRQPGERWCNYCTDWRGIITTGSELDICFACKDWRRRDEDEFSDAEWDALEGFMNSGDYR